MKIPYKSIFFSLIIMILFSLTSLRLLNIEINRIKKSKINFDKTIRVYLNQHPYSEAIIKEIPIFEKKTGIKVEYSVSKEDIYQNKIYPILKNKPQELDVFMAGPYNVWKYSYDNLIEDLTPYISNPELTNESSYQFEDFIPETVKVFKWNKVPGDSYGEGALWGIPLGFELTSISYNKNLITKEELDSIKTMDDFIFYIKKFKYTHPALIPIGMRGFNYWTTISGGYINLYHNYGLRYFHFKDGMYISDIDRAKFIEFNIKFIEMMKTSIGNNWSNYSWYTIGSNLGNGKTAFIIDADNNGYFQNLSELSLEKNNIAIYPISSISNGNGKANIWAWGLSMNSSSKNKKESWEFIKYFTSREFFRKTLQQQYYLNVPRKSILYAKDLAINNPHIRFLRDEIKNSELMFTPTPYATDIMKDWIEILHDIYFDKISIETGLDNLENRLEEYSKKKM